MKNVWLLVLACICMTACRNRQQSAEVTNYDLPQIKDSGELVALPRWNFDTAIEKSVEWSKVQAEMLLHVWIKR